MSHLTTDPEVHLADNLFLTRQHDRDGDKVYTSLTFRLKLFRDVIFRFDSGDSRFYKQIPKFLSGEKSSLELSYNSAFVEQIPGGYELRFIGREGGSLEVPLTKNEAWAIVESIQKLQKPSDCV